MDEYTSLNNCRYLNLNLHSYDGISHNFFNLGMIRINGSLPSDVIVDMVKKKLLEFGVSLRSDIVSAASDGASVMEKFVRAKIFHTP